MEPKLWAFLELVQQMRKKQVEYFTKGRDANVLFESKELERKVDKMARDYRAILPPDDGAIKTKMSSEDNKGGNGVSHEVTKEQIDGIKNVEVPYQEEIKASKGCTCDCESCGGDKK